MKRINEVYQRDVDLTIGAPVPRPLLAKAKCRRSLKDVRKADRVSPMFGWLNFLFCFELMASVMSASVFVPEFQYLESAEGKPITFGFDAQGRVTSITNAIGNVTRYQFDANGNMTNRTDAMNRSTGYVFDEMNRIDRIEYPNGSTSSFDHDPNGNVINTHSPLATCHYSHDSMNRLASSLITSFRLQTPAI
jgi:YD repeat-containing protein